MAPVLYLVRQSILARRAQLECLDRSNHTGTAAGPLGTYTRTYTVQDSSNPKQSYSKSLDLTITN